MTQPARDLARLARQITRERLASSALLGAGAGTLVAALLHRAGVPLPAATLTGAGAILGALALPLLARRRAVDARIVALHVDRAVPEMEESTALLLEPADALPPLAALQRARVAPRWRADRARRSLPHRATARTAIAGLVGGALGLLLLVLGPAATLPATARAHGPPVRVPVLRGVRLDIQPPAYTHRPERQAEGDDLEAEEGSALRWQVRTGGAVGSVWRLSLDGDSVPLRADGPDRWSLAARADHAELVRFRLHGGDSVAVTSDDYRLTVRPDLPPVLTLIEPTGRTELAPDSIRALPVRVRATDDYGLDSMDLAVTLASGRGEAVRFRRFRVPFSSSVERPDGRLYQATLDLPGLALGPGDELYFYAEATDHRVPIPNHARSATAFVAVRDTSEPALADLARVTLGAQPDYFRSERQLIIDTERLLHDRRHLSSVGFRQRSNELGADQGLLRLRYGQFLGEEYEEEAPVVSERERPAEPAPTPPPDQAAPPDPTAGLVHQHDDAENVTLLARTVKDKLRAAVGQMWQAELHLRVAQPEQALPFEHHALDLLKQVQQDSRAYVLRVGFEPPPIEVRQLRLTGKLSGIRDQSEDTTVAGHDSLAPVRAALATLQSGGPAPDAGRIQAAGQALAPLALRDPRLLEVLRELRRLADTTRRGGDCPDCRDRAVRGLWRVLPPAEPRAPPPATAASPMERRFGQLSGDRS